MRGDQQRRALGAHEFEQAIDDLFAGQRIEPLERFIEDQHLGMERERRHECRLHALAARGPGQPGRRREVQRLQQPRRQRVVPAPVERPAVGEQVAAPCARPAGAGPRPCSRRARRSTARGVRESWPSISARPDEGGSRLTSTLSSVDLPAPFEPMSPTACPCGTRSDTSSSAWTLPNVLPSACVTMWISHGDVLCDDGSSRCHSASSRSCRSVSERPRRRASSTRSAACGRSSVVLARPRGRRRLRDARADARVHLQQAERGQLRDGLLRGVGVDAQRLAERADRRKGVAGLQVAADHRARDRRHELLVDGHAGHEVDAERQHKCISTTSTLDGVKTASRESGVGSVG